MKKLRTVVFLTVVASILAMASIGLAASAFTVDVASNQALGGYLVDKNGNSLYYFTKDEPGVSTCKGQCVVNWPVFYTDMITVPPQLDPADFGTITREDGIKQTTYRGWPLYYFFKDQMPGDVKGHKVNNVWFVVPVE